MSCKNAVVYFQRFPGIVPLPNSCLDFSFISVMLIAFSFDFSYFSSCGALTWKQPQQARLATSPGLGLYRLQLEWAGVLQCWSLFPHCDTTMNTYHVFRDFPILRSNRCPDAHNLLQFPRTDTDGTQGGGGLSPLTYVLRFLVML